MGVREYFLYAPEQWHRWEDEPRLWCLHLSAEEEYDDIEPLRLEDGLPVYRSEMLGEFRMLNEGGDVHTLQTRNATRGIWLDPARARDWRTGAQNILSLLK